MAEVGLLIGFGVLLGSLLLAMGALQKLVEVLLRIFGPQKLPYAFSAALSAIFPAIYVDVQLVLAAPLARSAAPRMSRDGIAMMGGTLTAGILVGYVFVVPGLGTVAIARLLNARGNYPRQAYSPVPVRREVQADLRRDIGMLLFVGVRAACTRGNDDRKRRAGLGF